MRNCVNEICTWFAPSACLLQPGGFPSRLECFWSHLLFFPERPKGIETIWSGVLLWITPHLGACSGKKGGMCPQFVSSWKKRVLKIQKPHVLASCPQSIAPPPLHYQAHSWQQCCFHGDNEWQEAVIKKGCWSHKSLQIAFKGTQPPLKW